MAYTLQRVVYFFALIGLLLVAAGTVAAGLSLFNWPETYWLMFFGGGACVSAMYLQIAVRNEIVKNNLSALRDQSRALTFFIVPACSVAAALSGALMFIALAWGYIAALSHECIWLLWPASCVYLATPVVHPICAMISARQIAKQQGALADARASAAASESAAETATESAAISVSDTGI